MVMMYMDSITAPSTMWGRKSHRCYPESIEAKKEHFV
jgi:hypothetical protein